MGRRDRDNTSYDADDDIDIRSIRRDDRLSQSGPGIASILLAVCGVFAILALIVVAALMGVDGGHLPDDSPEEFLIGLGFLGCLGGWLIGAVLGLVGTLQSDRNRVCAVVGLILNTLFLIGISGLVVLALIVRN